MPRSAPATQTRSFIPLVAGLIAVLVAVGAFFYLSRQPAQAPSPSASPQAKAYLPNLVLSDVTMQASENFMRQQVIEITGKIKDAGPRSLKSVDVFCLFFGVDGREIHRERLPIVSASNNPLRPGEIRSFRLPFDSLPEGWNQTLPRMVIAQITFAS